MLASYLVYRLTATMKDRGDFEVQVEEESHRDDEPRIIRSLEWVPDEYKLSLIVED